MMNTESLSGLHCFHALEVGINTKQFISIVLQQSCEVSTELLWAFNVEIEGCGFDSRCYKI